jgi:hypothetical protein
MRKKFRHCWKCVHVSVNGPDSNRYASHHSGYTRKKDIKDNAFPKSLCALSYTPPNRGHPLMKSSPLSYPSTSPILLLPNPH